MLATAAESAYEPCADSGPRRVCVLVLDDEDLVHWGFRLLLANQPWAERCLPARHDEEALGMARRYTPHVALVDLGALEMEPGVFCRALAEASPRTRVLLLTTTSALPASTLRAYGAAGYVSRTWNSRDLLSAIRLASAGRACPPRLTAAPSSLSARQEEILQLIAAGATNAEIAGRLYLSRHTVKQHTSALYRKLNVRNRTHAVQAAQRAGLIPV
ncbi:MAG: response regulator transcription factor [Solirubrobacteraceae bacterium]